MRLLNMDSRISLFIGFLTLLSFLLSGCGGSSGGSSTQTPIVTPPAQSAPDFAQVQAEIDRHPISDMAVIIGDKDGELFRYEKGNFSVDTAVNIASGTKLYTGLGVWSLVEQGTLSLDTTPQTYIDFWTNDPTDALSEITVSDLLSFTSGFNARPVAQSCPGDATLTLTSCITEIYNGGIDTAPSSTFAYGPEHMQIVALMVKEATGNDLKDFIDTNIFQASNVSQATSYPAEDGDNVRYSGGAISTAEDYGKVLTAFLNGDLIADLPAFLKDRTANTQTDYEIPAVTETMLDWHYGFGFWKECDVVPYQPSCDEEPTISSPGAFGFLPWVDFKNEYWGVIAMEESVTLTQRPSVDSVQLEQLLQPLIEAALVGN